MTLDDIAVIADTLGSVGADSLGPTADEVEAAARAYDISIISATIDLACITLDSELDAAYVVDLAARCGSKLIYVARTVVDSSSIRTSIGDIEAPSGGDGYKKAALRAMLRIDGFTTSVSVGFAHNGIVHTWRRETSWGDDLEVLQEAIDCMNDGRLRDALDDDGDDQRIADEADELIAEGIAADPAFRRARIYRDKESAALALPVVAQLVDADPWHRDRLIRLADEILAKERLDLEDDLTARIGELAPQLAGSSEYQSVSNADGRERVAAKWIAENYSNGLRVRRAVIREFASTAYQARKNAQLGLV